MDCKSVKYPIYIISKGRAYNPLTANLFKKIGINFLIAVEPQEYKEYCEAVGIKYVLKLPFKNLGLGSYPARNFCWEHSIKNGHKKHWIFDDNIRHFRRLNNGKRTECDTKEPFLICEQFTDRFSNVKISGFNYTMFATSETKKPFTYNTHVYSALLIDNDISFRWRLKYNEDIDLCLQVLANGYCTILLNAFLIEKVSTTSKMKGGNQEELYQNNNHQKKILKAKSIELIWPEYVKTIWRFNRPHHSVSWKKHFKQPLVRNYKE